MMCAKSISIFLVCLVLIAFISNTLSVEIKSRLAFSQSDCVKTGNKCTVGKSSCCQTGKQCKPPGPGQGLIATCQ